MDNKMTFDELREMLLYRKIVKWDKNIITLDNGIEISIEETEQDCCAVAGGEFTDVVLDAAITKVGDIQYTPWKSGDEFGEYGCSATVTIMHNRNIICKAIGEADAGNGGYYYSIASFVVKFPMQEQRVCHFVGSDDKGIEEGSGVCKNCNNHIREKLVELIKKVPYGVSVGATFERYFCEKIADHLIANNVTVQEWIPVSEPPKEWRRDNGEMINYLVYVPEYGVDIGNYGEPAKCWLCMGLPCKPTHWAPMPQPPKGE